MRRTRLRLSFAAVIALVVLLGGCKSDPADSPAAAPASRGVSVDPALGKLLDRLGDGAPVVGVFDPRSWPTVHARLAPLMARVSPPVARAFEGWKDPTSLLQVAVSGALETPAPSLSGLDPTRPIAFSLYEPTVGGAPGSTVGAIDFEQAVPLRHEVVLPARDAGALEAALRGLLSKAAKPVAHGFDMGILQIGLKVDGDVVRVAALLPASPEQVDALWRPTPRASVRTPAFATLATPGAALGVLVRPWRLRSAWGVHGAGQMALALDSAPADMRMALFARGLAIVLSGSRHMFAERPEFEDVVLRLRADEAGLAFEGTHSLTALLRDALVKGGKGARFPTRVPVLAESWQRVDLRGLMDAMGPRPIFATARRPRDVARSFQDCGPGCALHALLRAPFGTARTLVDLAPAEVKTVTRNLPTAMQVALVGMDGRLPQVAFAADVSKSFDTGLLRAAGAPMQVHLVPRGERAALLLGIGIDPRTVFDTDKVAPADGLGGLDVDTAALGSLLGGIVPQAEPMLKGLGRLTGAVRHPGNGHAVAWRLHLATAPGEAASAFEPAVGAPFKGPIRGFAESAGNRCLGTLVSESVKIFDTLSNVENDKRIKVLTEAFSALEAPLGCAQEHEATRSGAAGFRRLFVRLALMTASSGQPAGVVPFVKAQCEASKDAWICEQVARAEAMPSLAPPEVKLHCTPAYGGGRHIQVSAKGLQLDGKPTTLAAIGALSEPISVTADAALPFSAVRAVLEKAPKEAVQIGVLSGGRARQILIGTPYAGKPATQPRAQIIRARRDEKHADVLARIDAARRAGAKTLTLQIDGAPDPAGKAAGKPHELVIRANESFDAIIARMDAAKAARAGDIVLKDGGVVPVPDKFKALLRERPLNKDLASKAAWEIRVKPGLAAARRQADLEPAVAGPVERGDALRQAVGVSASRIVVDPATPWGEVAQVLAAVCEHGQLVDRPMAIPSRPMAPPSAEHDAVAEPRSKEAIRRVMQHNSRKVRLCYERALMKDPKLAGKLTVSFAIQPDGSVDGARAEALTGVPATVGDCIVQSMATWRFEKAEAVTRIRYPFVFTPAN